MPPRNNYTYLSLHDAFQGPRPSLVNIYAIVAEWTMPRSTKGSDLHVVLKVLDPSVASLTTEQNNSYTDVSVNFFASKELLPKPRKVGDIVRLHRLEVKEFNHRTQLVAKIGMMSGGRGAGGPSRCHYCLFEGEGDKKKNKKQKSKTENRKPKTKNRKPLCTIRDPGRTQPPSQPLDHLLYSQFRRASVRE